jgi:hypothetical protein
VGYNAFGQLRNRLLTNQTSPVQIALPAGSLKLIEGGPNGYEQLVLSS